MKTFVCPYCHSLFDNSHLDYFKFIDLKKCSSCTGIVNPEQLDELLKEVRIFGYDFEVDIIRTIFLAIILILSLYKQIPSYIFISLCVFVLGGIFIYMKVYFPYVIKQKPLYIINDRGIKFCISNAIIFDWDDIELVKIYGRLTYIALLFFLGVKNG